MRHDRAACAACAPFLSGGLRLRRAAARCAWALLAPAVLALALAHATPAAAQGNGKEKIAVLKLDGVGASDVEAEAITDRLREVLLKTGRFTMVDRSELDAILNEQAFQQAGCSGQDCAVKVGRILGVRQIVTGKAVKFSPGMWQISGMIVDVETAEAVRADTVRHQGDIFTLLDQTVPKLALRLAATGGVAAVSAPPPAPAAPQPAGMNQFEGVWSEMAPLATGRTDHTAAVLGAQLYVFGGADPQEHALDSVEVYDAAHNTWRAGPPLPAPRTLATAAALDGRLYVLGGRRGKELLARVDVLDPSIGAWTPGPPLPSPRAGAMSVVVGGRLYVLGGLADDHEYLDQTLVLARSGDRWEPVAPMQNPRAFGTVQALDGHIYVFGGESRSKGLSLFNLSVSIKYAERYDTAHNRWQTLKKMPKSRSRLSSAVIQGQVYVFGGYLGNIVNLSAYGEYQVYDPQHDRWEKSGSMDRVRAGHTSDVVAGHVYFVGGKPEQWARVTELR